MRHRTNETALRAIPGRRQEPPILTAYLFTRLLLLIAMWPYGLWLSIGYEVPSFAADIPLPALLLWSPPEPEEGKA